MINEFRPMNHLTSLQNLICTIGNLPTSYVLSLSYEEQIWWLCDFLENKVFPAIEENTNITEETQASFIELQNYVKDYFNNLDVQQEINNKLDEMAQSGTLEEIISLYLQTNAMITFNNIQDLKNANNLVDGSKCSILCKENINDFEYTVYLVRNKDINDIEKIPNIIFLQNDLVAEMIENPYVNKYFDSNVPLSTHNQLKNMYFRLKNSRNLKNNLRMLMAKMDLTTDFPHDEDQNLYSGVRNTQCTEVVSGNTYSVSNTSGSIDGVIRYFTGLNPFAIYEINAKNMVKNSYGCRFGLYFSYTNNTDMRIFMDKTDATHYSVKYEFTQNGVSLGTETLDTIEFDTEPSLQKLYIIKKINAMEVYIDKGGNLTLVGTINCDVNNTAEQFNFDILNKTRVALYVRLGNNESIVITKVECYYSSLFKQADIRPIKYTNGETLIENGKVFYTVGLKTKNQAIQGIISQKVGSSDFELTGILLMKHGATIFNDLASSIKYDKKNGLFYIWTCHNNGVVHELGYGTCFGNLLHGINIVDINLMPHENDDENGRPIVTNDESFFAKFGDEDPEFFYNEQTHKWHLFICRLVTEDEDELYRYFQFISDNPFTDYTFVNKTLTGSNTGGSIVKVNNTYLFVCGSNFHVTSQYNIYNITDLSQFNQLNKDINDGGFRGWGSVFSIPCGSYTKYGFITFDRDKFSDDDRWSYGNLYYYESDLYNIGSEFKIKNNF